MKKSKVRFKKTTYFFICLFASLYTSNTQASALEDWSGSVFAGYNKTNGNTKKGSANISADAIKKLDAAQFKLKGSLSYSETDNRMDTQKWDSLARYSKDFGEENAWFSYIQITGDHDYFADIDYRITPGVGIGYHIAREEDWTWDIDGGLGYRITRHRINTATDDEALTAIIHTFAKKKIFQNAFLSEDLTVYPGLESGSGVVLRSETALTNPISENLDFQIKYILDFNSEPAINKKKTDTEIIAGITYKFE